MKFECSYKELVSIEELKPNPKNNNKHPKKQIERLAKIIEYQGQRSPIVISNRSGFIVKGHARLEALKLLGWTEAAVDYQDYQNAAQEYADMTADNEISRWAELDMEAMEEALKEFPELDTSMLGLSFEFGEANWDSDIQAIDDVEENDSGVPAIIKVHCPQEDRDVVVQHINDMLKAKEIVGVKVE
jgi:predicted RNA-binding protein with PUA-like domain